MLSVLPIKSEETDQWVLRKHYARRKPPISFAFGLYKGAHLVGVTTYGSPPSPHLCRGICGDDYEKIVLELNRLVVDCGEKNAASTLVGRSLKLLPKPSIVVSFADTAQGHIGYVYQSTNFIYTGAPTSHDREYLVGGKKVHSKTLRGDGITSPMAWAMANGVETVAPLPKHRYVKFVGNKRQKRELESAMKYKQLPYPKGDSRRYDASCRVITQERLL